MLLLLSPSLAAARDADQGPGRGRLSVPGRPDGGAGGAVGAGRGVQRGAGRPRRLLPLRGQARPEEGALRAHAALRLLPRRRVRRRQCEKHAIDRSKHAWSPRVR